MQRTALNNPHEGQEHPPSLGAAIGFMKFGSAITVGVIAAVYMISALDIGKVQHDAATAPTLPALRTDAEAAAAAVWVPDGYGGKLNMDPLAVDAFGKPFRYDANGDQIGWNNYPFMAKMTVDVIACDSVAAFDYLDLDGMEGCTIVPAGTEIAITGNGPILTYVATPVEVSELYGPEDGVVDGKVTFYFDYHQMEAVLTDDGRNVRPAGYTGPHWIDGMS